MTVLIWLAANAGTIVVCVLVLVIAALAVRTLIRDKRRGKSPCGGSCSGCAGCGACHGGAQTHNAGK